VIASAGQRIIEHGDRFGKLTALKRVESKRSGETWRCGCVCGFSGLKVRAPDLHSGKVTSCLKCRTDSYSIHKEK